MSLIVPQITPAYVGPSTEARVVAIEQTLGEFQKAIRLLVGRDSELVSRIIALEIECAAIRADNVTIRARLNGILNGDSR